MLRLLYGSDSWSRDAALRDLVAALGPADMVSLNTTRLDGRSTSLPEISGNASTMPFLAEHRVVLVSGFGARFERRGAADADDPPPGEADSAKGDLAALPEMAAGLPPFAVIVFLDDALGASNAFLKAMQKAGTVQEFRPGDEAQLARWIQEQVQARGGSIAPAAARALAGRIPNVPKPTRDNYGTENREPDPRAASQEIDKLLAWAGDRTIEPGDVALLTVDQKPETETPFALLNAIEAGDVDAAIGACGEAMAAGRHPLVVLASLATVWRQRLLAEAHLAERYPDAEIPKLAGMSPQAFQRIRRSLPPRRVLESGLRRIAQADEAIKTGALDDETSLLLLATDLARGWTRR